MKTGNQARRNYRIHWDMEDECTIDVHGKPYVFQILINEIWIGRFVYFLDKTTFDAHGNDTERTVAMGHEASLGKAKKAALTAFRRHHNATLELAA
ncbi:hypothetical protein [Rhizobium sp. RCC_161_2]|uniref:hypothetical protein n=1 Tax=Rhizobium sp. RCC_161_2 TaxID=3239219 RepID=UPI003523C7DC